MLQVKSRYNERTKTKFNNKPWLLLRVTQVSELLQLTPNTRAPLPDAHSSLSQGIYRFPMNEGLCFLLLVFFQSTKKILVLLAVAGMGKQALCCAAHGKRVQGVT